MISSAALPPGRIDVVGKRALITGASRGIGQALAIGLQQAGARVAITARTVQSLSETADELKGLGGDPVVVALDVMAPDACALGVAEAARQLGGLDILINNAGVEEVRPSLAVDEALWDKIIDTNLKGAFFCAQAAAKIMLAGNSGGSIVNICSLTSEIGIATAVPYGASKSGLLGMTRALAVEWASHGIRVNGLAPGYFRTTLTDAFYQDPAWQQAMLAKIPLSRFGRMADLVGATVFLASDAASYVTGVLLPVDGGTLAAL